MEYCNRCKINEAKINCNKCKINHCKICDYYLHIIMKEYINNNNNKLQKIDNLSALENEDNYGNKNKNNNNEKINKENKNNFNDKTRCGVNFENEGIKTNNKDNEYLDSKTDKNKKIININDFEYNNLYNKESQDFLAKINDIIIKNSESENFTNFREINNNVDMNENGIFFEENRMYFR